MGEKLGPGNGDHCDVGSYQSDGGFVVLTDDEKEESGGSNADSDLSGDEKSGSEAGVEISEGMNSEPDCLEEDNEVSLDSIKKTIPSFLLGLPTSLSQALKSPTFRRVLQDDGDSSLGRNKMHSMVSSQKQCLRSKMKFFSPPHPLQTNDQNRVRYHPWRNADRLVS